MKSALTTGKRLFYGCMLIILVFLVATVLISLQVAELRAAAEEMKVLSEGIQASLMLGNFIREQYVHQAHVIIWRDAEHANWVDSARKHSDRWTSRMRQLVTNPEEAAVLDELGRTVDQFNAVFAQIVPLVQAGQTRQVRTLHDSCEKLVSRATEQIDRLVDRFGSRLDVARRRIDERGQQVVRVGFLCVGFALVMALVLAGALTRSITSPIEALIVGTREVAGGNLGKTLVVQSDDEFGLLARAFNSMTERLRARERELMESEKLATLGRLSAAVAHELNNPLGIMLGYLKTMLKGRSDDDPVAADLKILEYEAQQCARIVADLLSLARPADIEVRSVDLAGVVREAADRLRLQDSFAAIALDVQCTGDLRLAGDPDKLKQVLQNLAVNARDAMPGGGALSIVAGRTADVPPRLLERGWPARDAIRLELSDTGSGIPADKLDEVFQPFFTTKTNGTGLGLFICYHIVRAHAGDIECTSTQGKGTTVTIWLPPEVDR